MYRLLIVTKSPTIEKMFSEIDNWTTMGFKPPRIRSSFDDAIECMEKHHIDAIGIDAGFEDLIQWMDQNRPQIPIFMPVEDKEHQLTVIREVEILLNQIHIDDSNDDYNEESNFTAARGRWMKYIMSRLAPSKEDILKQHRLYRCVDDPERPCIFARISIPQGDMFITERWHYGSERLATALQNFFGEEYENLHIHIAVVSPEEVRIVFSPRAKTPAGDVPDTKVKQFIEDTIEQIGHYLGLSMSLMDMRILDDITKFAANCDWCDK